MVEGALSDERAAVPAAPVALTRELEAIEPLVRSHPDDALARADAALGAATACGAADLAQRARLVRADVLCRQGRLEYAARTARTVLAAAEESGARYVQARAHLVFELVFGGLGEGHRALEHALAAVQLLDDDVPDRLRLDCSLRLAGAIGTSGDRSGARERLTEAATTARSLGDDDLLWVALNNLAWNEHQDGEDLRALEVLDEVHTVTRRVGLPLHPGVVDTHARVLMALGRYPEAEVVLQELALGDGTGPGGEAAAPVAPDATGRAECLLAMAECRRRTGHLAAAQDALDACVAVCRASSLAGVRTRAHAEQCEVHAAAGRFEQALAEHRTFHRQTVVSLSGERDARARTLQAVFEAAEARQESRRYRELALRDALTGLANRRHIDAELPALLAACARAGTTLGVALVDLDHFKQVNDRCSHAVGDAVLERTAQLLSDHLLVVSAAEDRRAGFAARLGGEEFLLVLPAVSRASWGAVLAHLRRLVAAHPWELITGNVPVTVSIGATVVSPGAEPLTAAEALSRADAQLYEAKRAGRNRVSLA